MNKLKLIDKTKIGLVDFEAYVFKDENNLDAFGIFFESNNNPLIFFQQDINNDKVNINIDPTLVENLHTLKTKDIELRKEHFKTFQQFVLDAEETAKEMFLKDKKLNYITDIQLLKSIEQAYLID